MHVVRQSTLHNKLSLYCSSWDLTVNLEKTKVMIFNKSGKKLTKDKFVFNDNVLEHCTEYKYLGLVFKHSGSFTEALRLLCKKVSKAIFCIRKQFFFWRYFNVLPHLNLFDTCFRPILLYCSEVWSFYMIKDITNLGSKCWSLATIKILIKFTKT